MIARVFPRRTNATPTDKLAFVGMPDLLTPEWFDEVHISVAFTYDIPYAEKLAEAWGMRTSRISIGGPGTGMRGGEFQPGMYLKKGYLITSRGCPNKKCWFCTVPKREGGIRELEIHAGWNVLDDNLLACSVEHITNVFKMLMKVKKVLHKPIEFTGGFEAKRLSHWHCEWLYRLKPKQVFFSCDMPGDGIWLSIAGDMLRAHHISRESLRCYVLCGYEGDTFEKAEKRLKQVIKDGFIPMAMLYRDEKGNYKKDWTKFQKEWTRPAIMRAKGLI
jgi:hypothetical protein